MTQECEARVKDIEPAERDIIVERALANGYTKTISRREINHLFKSEALLAANDSMLRFRELIESDHYDDYNNSENTQRDFNNKKFRRKECSTVKPQS